MQHLFATALLDPAQPVPAGLRAWNGSDPAARLAVYRNNVISSLVDALADNCPVVQALVGEAFFRAMAVVFVRQAPPRSPILAHYGEGLAAFIAQFEPARCLPYLADVAALETARMRALHAADAPTLDPAAAQATLASTGDPGTLQLTWHPSTLLLRSRFAAVSVWAAHQGEQDPADHDLGAIDLDQAEDALVLRDSLAVIVLRLPPGAADFVAASQGGHTLGTAAEAALCAVPDFDLSACLTLLMRHGALTAISAHRSTP